MKQTSMPVGMIFLGCLIAVICTLAIVPHRPLVTARLPDQPLIMPAR
ncbi:hypothetical protein [Rhizobium rhizosphaerae]|nr:hypothetical protein [Xaviernesmea rhizosphaerae]